MPSPQPSKSTESVRLADVFVRLPNDHYQERQQQGSKPTAPSTHEVDSRDNTTPASSQHRPPTTSSQDAQPLTPQKPKTATTSLGPHPVHHQHHHPPLPPTPDATPTKGILKRPFPQTETPTSPSAAKRPRNNHLNAAFAPTPSPSPHRRHRFRPPPKFSIVYQPPHPHTTNHGPANQTHEEQTGEEEEEETEQQEPPVSWLELKRIAESVMRQVDWEQVALDAASNRGEGWYRKVVRGVLQERIEAIGAGEGGEEGEEGEEGGKEIGEEMGEN